MTRLTIAAVALAAAFQCSAADVSAAPRKSPELAFTVPGNGQMLLSQQRGKVVALEFILTTCPHCQAACAVMDTMQERYATRGFQAIDVAIDPNADLRVENFSKDFHAMFPVGWTTLDQMMSYMGFIERPVVPQLVLIDRAGNIRYQTPREGDPQSMNADVIAQRIEELLAARNVSKARRPTAKARRPTAKDSQRSN